MLPRIRIGPFREESGQRPPRAAPPGGRRWRGTPRARRRTGRRPRPSSARLAGIRAEEVRLARAAELHRALHVAARSSRRSGPRPRRGRSSAAATGGPTGRGRAPARRGTSPPTRARRPTAPSRRSARPRRRRRAPASRWRRMAAAIGLRQMLPVQTKRTVIGSADQRGHDGAQRGRARSRPRAPAAAPRRCSRPPSRAGDGSSTPASSTSSVPSRTAAAKVASISAPVAAGTCARPVGARGRDGGPEDRDQPRRRPGCDVQRTAMPPSGPAQHVGQPPARLPAGPG